MPYQKNRDLPDSVTKHLPTHAQDIYRKAFNHALEEYEDPHKIRDQASLEEVAHKVAWNAVKNVYEKDATSGKWKLKSQ